jgi:hypothetical protein
VQNNGGEKTNKIILPTPEKFHVKMKLFDINGEYAEKVVDVDDTIYDVTDTKSVNKLRKEGFTERKVDINGSTRDVLVRNVKKKVHAFPRNGLNQPLIPLGTTRGYITGVLCAISRDIGVQQGQPLYGILSWIQNGGVKITPYWVASSAKEVKIADFFVKEAKSKVYYEQIPEAEVDFDVTVIPRDGFDSKLIKELMKRGEGVGISPKRRGRYEIVEFS